jgi:hypothetical protein
MPKETWINRASLFTAARAASGRCQDWTPLCQLWATGAARPSTRRAPEHIQDSGGLGLGRVKLLGTWGQFLCQCQLNWWSRDPKPHTGIHLLSCAPFSAFLLPMSPECAFPFPVCLSASERQSLLCLLPAGSWGSTSAPQVPITFTTAPSQPSRELLE